MPLKISFSGYLTCPICEAEVPIAGDEKTGEEVYCPYCECPLVLRKVKNEDDFYLVEDI